MQSLQYKTLSKAVLLEREKEKQTKENDYSTITYVNYTRHP